MTTPEPELEQFMEVCHGFQPQLASQDCSSLNQRFQFWLEVVLADPDEERQKEGIRHYLSKHVPSRFWKALLKQNASRGRVVADLEV